MQVFAEQLPWWIGGLALGLITTGLQWVDNLPLGATGSFVAAVERRPDNLWRLLFFVAIPVGALLHTLLAGGLDPTWSNGAMDARLGGSLAANGALLVSAGAVMGYGARMAGGCTSGHGICGMARASTGSLVATMTFVAAAIVVANLLVRVVGI